MKKVFGAFVSVLVVITLGFLTWSDADAKRFGGGRSFGSKPSYRTPFKRSLAQKKTPVSQQRAAKQNQSVRHTLARRGGLVGALGGLALGGLLGALFFGGAFEHLNVFDVLVFGLIAFLLLKLFSSRRMAGVAQPAANFDTDVLSKQELDSDSGEDAIFEKSDESTFDVPEGFDKDKFVSGAESAYKMLQDAWCRADLNDIRHLVTDKVFAEIQEQMQTSEKSNWTEIIRLNTELLYVREVGNEWEASVLYDAVLRESESERPQQVREIWHYIKPKKTPQPTWFLDGIQQMETD